MRRTVSLLISFVTIFALTACGQSAASESGRKNNLLYRKQRNKPKHLTV